MDLDAVASRRDDDVFALVAVNVLGYTSPMREVAAFCDDRDLCLVETLGYALGSSYRGRRLGTFGDRAVLNFQQGKPIPVGGGMVVSRGATRRLTDRGRPSVDPNVGALAGYAAVEHPGYTDSTTTSRTRSTDYPPSASARPPTRDRRATWPTSARSRPCLTSMVRSHSGCSSTASATAGPERPPPGFTPTGSRRSTVSDCSDPFVASKPPARPISDRPPDGSRARRRQGRTPGGRDREYGTLRVAGPRRRCLPRCRPPPAPSPDAPTHPYVDERDRRAVVDTVRSTVGTISP